LIIAIKAYLKIANEEVPNEERLLSALALVFVEHMKADEQVRIGGIRELVGAYANGKGERATLAPYVLLHRLPIGKDELALAIRDRLFDGSERDVRSWARLLNDKIGSESLSGYVDLRELERRGKGLFEDDKSLPLVRYLFQKSPSSALLLLARVEVPGKQESELALKDRQITTGLFQMKTEVADLRTAEIPKAILAELADHPNRWVRLYTIEMMIQNPVLGDDAVVSKLSEDQDELIKLAVRDLKDPNAQFRHVPVRTPWSR
jgi:hypothetical protein